MKREHIHPSLTDILRNPFVRLRLAIVLGFALLGIGTAGFMLIEHYSPLDALYMTVITLSSVGFETIRPLDANGKLFTIGLIIVGIGTAAWVFTTVIEVFVSEQSLQIIARRRMDSKISQMHDHYIICGYGRIGQQIALGYTQNRVPHVVVEHEESRLELLRSHNVTYVEGDASDDEVLRSAGIEKAAALIAVTPTDAVNTFIVLSARGLRSDLFIVARADNLQNEAKLRRAGASQVVSAHVLGGRWMGITAINPAVTDFVTAMTDVDHSKFQLREFVVDSTAEQAGRPYGEWKIKGKTGALVVAVRKITEQRFFIPNPPDKLIIAPGDILIAIGTPEELSRVAHIANPAEPKTNFERRLHQAY